MNVLRVLHVIGIMDRGGAEAMIMNLYRQIDRSLIQFDFVQNINACAEYDDEINSLGGIIYHCPKYNGLNHLEYVKWWRTFFKIHKGEYSVIHGHIGSTASIYLNIAKKNGLITIAHSHNTNGYYTFKSVMYRILAYPTRYIAHYLFACSKQAGLDRYGRRFNISNPKCKIFFNAIDSQKYIYDSTAREIIRKEWDIGKKDFVVGHVGRFEMQKNHIFLLKVFRLVLKENETARLLLVGTGSLKKDIVSEAIKLGIQDQIIITGVQSKVQDYLSAMDVFVFPSLYEGLGVALVEAQASGLPCVVSDKIQREAILIPELVKVQKLVDTPSDWSKAVLNTVTITRLNRQDEIKKAGFDIHDSAIWLQEFYLNVGKKNNNTNNFHSDL